jgi:NSS family neurotransmitter:Na+ symporter
MQNSNQLGRPQWSSILSYLLVTTGAVVGLGNIFQFPQMVAKHGAMFILCYIVFELIVAVPILLAEIFIGRRGKQNPVGAFSIVAMEANASRYWRFTGWLCFIILVLTLSYYTVAVAFPLAYFAGLFSHFIHISNNQNILMLDQTLASTPILLEIYFLFFVFITLLVIKKGINRGLENISRITVPLFYLIFLGLAIYACKVGNGKAALTYLLDFHGGNLTQELLFDALIYAFFKLNIGMGCMMVYGSYLPFVASLTKSTLIIIVADIIASLLAFFILFPLALAHSNVIPVAGFAYSAVQITFQNIPHGLLLAMLFFFATTLAAWMPSIAIMESATLTLIERFNISRPKATYIISAITVLLGTAVVLSYNVWANIVIISHWTIHNIIQDLTTNILTPCAALLITLFAGFIMSKKTTFNELGLSPKIYSIWSILIKFVAPLCIIVLLASKLL